MWTFAPEQLAAQFVFELADGTGQRRLCYVALLCGTREIKRPRHCQEIANLVHFHRTAPHIPFVRYALMSQATLPRLCVRYASFQRLAESKNPHPQSIA
jgi:hypothetical protein